MAMFPLSLEAVYIFPDSLFLFHPFCLSFDADFLSLQAAFSVSSVSFLRHTSYCSPRVMSDKGQVLFFSQRFFFFVTTDKSGETKPASFNFFSIRLAGQSQAALWQRGFGTQSLLCSPRLFVIFTTKIYQKKFHINVDCTSLCISLKITR